ncbi:MAG: polysaccharide biosynthesis protein [Gemmatimonadetes bacterium]|nr:polysaccharide biosynthesis protein [Gemmatimonadota bacterium]
MSVLARRLSPADFGLVALAQVVLLFIVAGDSGAGTYVIADRGEDWRRRASSAFWLAGVMAGTQLLLLAVAIPFLARFYAEPRLSGVLWMLAGLLAVRQMASVPEAINRRMFRFRIMVVRDTACDILSAALSVVMAIRGYGVWSLLVPQVAVEPIRTVLIFQIAGWYPSLRAGMEDWKTILKYQAHVIATSYLGLIVNDSDTVTIGKVLGSASLGQYNLAWQLSNLVGRNLTGVVATVALPALAAIKHDSARLRANYHRMLSMLGALSFPILLFMFVTADHLVAFVYGPKWTSVSAILRIFIVFTIARSVTSPSGIVFNVMDRPDIGWRFNLAFVPFFLAGIAIGSHWGVIGVAVAVAAVRIVGALLSFSLSARLLGMAVLETLWTSFSRTALAALVMAGCSYALQRQLDKSRSPLVVTIAVCGVASIIVYAGALRAFAPLLFRDAVQIVQAALSRRDPRATARVDPLVT